jgi:hypothetical protein
MSHHNPAAAASCLPDSIKIFAELPASFNFNLCKIADFIQLLSLLTSQPLTSGRILL